MISREKEEEIINKKKQKKKNKNKKINVCQTCGLEFNTRNALFKHIKESKHAILKQECILILLKLIVRYQ